MGEILPISSRLTALACALLAAGALAACTPPEEKAGPTRIMGLRSGQGASFTPSPDGCALSLLFANSVSWIDSEKTATSPDAKTSALMFELLATSPTADTRLIIDLRGQVLGAKVDGTVQVNVSGANVPVTPPLEVTGEPFFRRVEAKILPAPGAKGITATPIFLVLKLPRPAPDAPPFEGILSLDSADFVVDDPTGPKPCTARAPEEAAKGPVTPPRDVKP